MRLRARFARSDGRIHDDGVTALKGESATASPLRVRPDSDSTRPRSIAPSTVLGVLQRAQGRPDQSGSSKARLTENALSALHF